jgi:histidinol-phosphate aminotransferase
MVPWKRPCFTPLVEGLPPTVPFVAPEALERNSGRRIRLRLGANESSFGVSPATMQAMHQAINNVAWYCDPESYELRSELARMHGMALENIVVGSGIDDLLGLITRTFLAPGEIAVASLGAYPTFAYHVAGYGGRIHRVAYKDGYNDLVGLEQAARQGARLVYLANPDNPTGTWYSASEIQEFRRQLPPSCLLLLDEAYVEFAPPSTAYPIDADDPSIIVVRTFSKAHGMAGARIGYAISAPDTIKAFDKVRLHFGVNRIAQAGALASLKDPGFIERVVAAVEEGRREYRSLGQDLGIPTLPSATNFVAFDIGSTGRARQLLDTLFDHGVFVRTPSVEPLSRYIRVTVGTPKERQDFSETFREILLAERAPAVRP